MPRQKEKLLVYLKLDSWIYLSCQKKFWELNLGKSTGDKLVLKQYILALAGAIYMLVTPVVLAVVKIMDRQTFMEAGWMKLDFTAEHYPFRKLMMV